VDISQLKTSESVILSDRLLETLRKDLRALLLFLLPHLCTFKDDLDWMKAATGMGLDEVEELRRWFLKEKAWVREHDGSIRLPLNSVGLGRMGSKTLSLPELFTMLPQILDCLSEEAPCWYEVRTVATTQALKTQFLSEIGVAINKFLRSSEEAQAETIVTWAHISLDSMKHLKEDHANEQ
jgi:hypothetical protein